MAYNRKNILHKIIDIQTIYKEKSQKWDGELTDVRIYREYIAPVHHISKRTFYEYLGTNAMKELRDIDKAEKMQTKLFE
jgi:hypothetical protein